MNVNDVNNWLSGGKDYVQGAEIFAKLSRNKNLIRLFADDHPNKYKQAKLAAEMAKLAKMLSPTKPVFKRKPVAQPVAVVSSAPAQPVRGAHTKVAAPVIAPVASAAPASAENNNNDAGNLWIGEWNTLPEVIKDTINKIKDLAKEQDFLRHNLEKTSGNDEAEAAGLRIMAIEDELKDLRKILFNYKETGKLPDVKQLADEKQIMKDISRRNNIRTYISRDEDNPKKAEKVKKWKEELAEIEKRLA